MHLEKGCAVCLSVTSSELNEAEAIRRARGGDRSVFEYLYRSHSRRVYALCLRMVGNTTEAEDLDSRNLFTLAPQDSHFSRRIGLLYLAAQAGG